MDCCKGQPLISIFPALISGFPAPDLRVSGRLVHAHRPSLGRSDAGCRARKCSIMARRASVAKTERRKMICEHGRIPSHSTVIDKVAMTNAQFCGWIESLECTMQAIIQSCSLMRKDYARLTLCGSHENEPSTHPMMR